MKEESSSSEDDDEDEEEEQEEDASGEEEEVKAEACARSSMPRFPKLRKFFKWSCFLSTGGSGAFPRGAGELSAAAVQVYGRQR